MASKLNSGRNLGIFLSHLVAYGGLYLAITFVANNLSCGVVPHSPTTTCAGLHQLHMDAGQSGVRSMVTMLTLFLLSPSLAASAASAIFLSMIDTCMSMRPRASTTTQTITMSLCQCYCNDASKPTTTTREVTQHCPRPTMCHPPALFRTWRSWDTQVSATQSQRPLSVHKSMAVHQPTSNLYRFCSKFTTRTVN